MRAIPAHTANSAQADHSHCAHDPSRALEGRGVRLTESRQRVLDQLCLAGRPIGAYEMMDLLAFKNGKRPAPISVYRALDFLVDQGLVHRLASRNAFLACGHDHNATEPVAFLICDNCGEVGEATSPNLAASLNGLAGRAGFQTRAPIIEIAGLCARCAQAVIP